MATTNMPGHRSAAAREDVGAYAYEPASGWLYFAGTVLGLARIMRILDSFWAFGLGRPSSEDWPAANWTPVTGSSISCCCPATPKVQVVMPPPTGVAPVELLLCGHHFRVSSQALLTSGAAAYDVDGTALLSLEWDQPRRPPTPARIGSDRIEQPSQTLSRR